MTFYNGSMMDKFLDLDKITIANGKLYYHPTLTKNGKFYDLGVPYANKQLINAGEYLDATLTFEIPVSVNSNNFTLRVQYALDSVLDNVVARYKNFDIKVQNIDKNINTYKVDTTSAIETNVVNKNKLSLTINNYNLMDTYDNKYVVCKKGGECQTISSLITTPSITRETMMVVDFKGSFYEDSNFTKVFNTYNKIFANYAYLRYKVYSNEYYDKVEMLMDYDVSGKVFIRVDRRIMNASQISLEFKFRNNTYVVELKKGK